MVERNYELRKLCADDIFPMVNIISKFGIENMADCFYAKEMSDIMNSVDSTLDEADGKESSDNAMADVLTKQIGIKVIMKFQYFTEYFFALFIYNSYNIIINIF